MNKKKLQIFRNKIDQLDKKILLKLIQKFLQEEEDTTLIRKYK